MPISVSYLQAGNTFDLMHTDRLVRFSVEFLRRRKYIQTFVKDNIRYSDVLGLSLGFYEEVNNHISRYSGSFCTI